MYTITREPAVFANASWHGALMPKSHEESSSDLALARQLSLRYLSKLQHDINQSEQRISGVMQGASNGILAYQEDSLYGFVGR